MAGRLLPLALLALLLAAGCVAPASREDPASTSTPLPAPVAGAAPFATLVCAGDRLVPLAGDHHVNCNAKATVDGSGPAAEVSLAADPRDEGILVGGAKDFSLRDGAPCTAHNVWSGVFRSADGGRTWSHSLLHGWRGDPHATILSDYDCASDPVLAFDSDGVVYYASLAFTLDPSAQPPSPLLSPVLGGSLRSALTVSRSRDGGATWDDPVLLTKRGQGGGLDKEWVAIDPATGQVYVSYIDVDASTFFVQRSDDHGLTWTEPMILAKADRGSSEPTGLDPLIFQFGQISIGTDHVAHFVFVRAPLGNEPAAIVHAASTDGGKTWSKPTEVGRIVPVLDLGVQRKYRVVGMPSLAEDAATGALFVAFPSRDPADSDLFVTRSTDGGRTWSAPVRVNDDVPGYPTNDQWQPAIAVGPDHAVHVTWMDYRDDPAGQSAYVYYAYSADGGRTWSRNARVSDAPFDGTGGYHQSGSGTIGDYMGLVATPHAVHPFWADTRASRNDVFSATIV